MEPFRSGVNIEFALVRVGGWAPTGRRRRRSSCQRRRSSCRRRPPGAAQWREVPGEAWLLEAPLAARLLEDPGEATVAAILAELMAERPGPPIMVRSMAAGEDSPPRLSPLWRLAQFWRLCPPGPSPRCLGVRHTTMTAATIISNAIRALMWDTAWSRIPAGETLEDIADGEG